MRGSVAIGLCIGALALVACGGDDDGGDEALSDEEYVAQATEICSSAESQVTELQEAGNVPSTPQEIESFFGEEVVPIYRESIDKLDALEPPEEKAADHDAFIDNANSLGDKLEEDPAEFVRQSLSGEQPPEVAELQETGQRLGIGACFQT